MNAIANENRWIISLPRYTKRDAAILRLSSRAYATAFRTRAEHGGAARVPGHGAARGGSSGPILLPDRGRDSHADWLRLLDFEHVQPRYLRHRHVGDGDRG